MPPAVIGGGLAAVGAIGGAILGGNAQKKTAEQANQSQQATVAAQLQLGQQSLALQERLANQSLGLTTDIYNSNYDLLSPYVSRGNVAGDAINALLGLSAAPAMTSPLANRSTTPATGGTTGGTPPATTPPAAPPPPVTGNSGVQFNPSAGHILAPGAVTMPAPSATTASDVPLTPMGVTGSAGSGLASGAMSPAARALLMGGEPMGGVSTPTQGPGSWTSSSAPGQVAGAGANTIGGGSAPPPAAPPPAAPPVAPPPATTPPATTPPPATPTAPAMSAEDAFRQFANSAGMQFALDTMYDAVNNGYAGIGALQSGAAMKELQDRASDIAIQGYFMPYMGLLGGQQATGAQAAAATAGVGSSFGNTAANINAGLASGSAGTMAGMGGALQAGGNAASNAAIIGGLANAGMYSGIGSALGQFGSTLASSYGAPAGSGPIVVTSSGGPGF